MRAALLAVLLSAAASGQVCGRSDLYGPFGFRLSGVTTISGDSKPMAAVGRLVFDDEGHVTGVSSVNFGGWYLGNPVTGAYSFDEKTCAFTFDLRDDSGSWQHFRGTAAPGGRRGEFTQTDPGADGRGTLERMPERCDASTLRGRYAVVMGTLKTVTLADGNGGLSWSAGDVQNSGTYEVDSDCFVNLNFGVQLRGALVNEGKTVLAVQTDPGQVATATFTAQ
jgi:hypothetical protein